VPWRVLRDLFADAPAAVPALRSCWQLTLVDLTSAWTGMAEPPPTRR
jgi:hypothetical protein